MKRIIHYLRSGPTHSIRGKILLSLYGVLLLGVIATLTANYATNRMKDKIRIIEFFYELNQKVLEMRRYEKNFLLFNDANDLKSALDYLEQVKESIGEIHRLTPEKIHEQNPSVQQLLSGYEKVFQELSRPNISQGRKIVLHELIRKKGHTFTSLLLDMDKRACLEVESEVNNYVTLSFITMIMAIVAGAILVIFLVHWIMKPLESIREAASGIMDGIMTFIPIGEDIQNSIETMELVNSLNMMLDALEKKQNQLVQSAKLVTIGKVMAGIAHEINNPLNNISLTAEVLQEEFPDLEEQQRMEMVEDIVQQSNRAHEVVHRLLEFSKSRAQEDFENLDMIRLIRDSVSLVKNQFRLEGISYEFVCSSRAIWISGDSNQLTQVIVNLALNAVQAMKPGGHLKISVAGDEDTGTVVVEVADTGSGIPEEIQENIFDPFFTTRKEGTGLGLSLSYAIIRNHNGNIDLESQMGRGAIFRIILPLVRME